MPPVAIVQPIWLGPTRAAAAVYLLDQAREGGVTLIQRGVCWRAGVAHPSVGAATGAIRSADRAVKLRVAQADDVDASSRIAPRLLSVVLAIDVELHMFQLRESRVFAATLRVARGNKLLC